MTTRPPEPQFLLDYRHWLQSGPPKCCHTCDHYSKVGHCMAFDMQPPEDFAASVGACEEWVEMIPF